MNEWERQNEEAIDDDAVAELVRQRWREEYARREIDGMPGQTFALTDKERFEVDEIIKERLNALDWDDIIRFKRQMWERLQAGEPEVYVRIGTVWEKLSDVAEPGNRVRIMRNGQWERATYDDILRILLRN